MEATRGTALVFAVSGAVQASWMSRLPAIADRLKINTQGLGLALAALGVGTLAGMLAAGRLSRRYGSRRVLARSSILTVVLLLVASLMPTPPLFAGSILVFGLAAGSWDAAMNVHGTAIERATERHLMSRFHGFWSVGTVVGAAVGATAAKFDVPFTGQCAAVGAIAFALTRIAARSFESESAPPADRPHLSRPIVALAALTLLGALIEGAANDWLAFFLAARRGFTHAEAAAGYALFVAAMALGRFGAERAHTRMGPTVIVGGGALLAGSGVVTTVLASTSALVLAGAVTWGLGISVVFPAAVSAAGSTPHPDETVAAMTTIGYAAGLLGPIVLGLAAASAGLETALLSLSACAVVLAMLAPSARGAAPTTR